MLAGEEFATAVLAHGSWAGGSVGFGCRHLGEEALKGRRKVLKTRVQRKAKQPNQIYYIGRIHRCKEVKREKKKSRRGNITRLKKKKTEATTYFGCTVAPGDSCGVPSHAVLPSDASPASSVPPRWDDPGTAERHRNPVHCQTGACGCHRTR